MEQGLHAALKILMVASSFPASHDDWRSVFIRQLADAMARNTELDPVLWAPPGDTLLANDLRGDEREWLSHLMAVGGIAHLLRNEPLRGLSSASGLLRRLRNVYRRNEVADVYHVNWLQNALALPNNGKPILVTVLGSDLKLMTLAPVRWAMRRLLRRHPAIICPNAAWMVDPLRSALGREVDIRVVPFGIDSAWYDVHRVPSVSNPRWLAVTRLTKSKLGDLFEWGERWFSGVPRELHLFGPMQEDIRLPEWVTHHGPTTPQELRQKWFPGATGLITLSRHSEGRPQVMLEAMASGLPIIASGIDAHTNFLEHGKSAWICSSAAALGKGLEWLEDKSINSGVGVYARQWALWNVGNWDDCVRRYLPLYRELAGLQSDG